MDWSIVVCVCFSLLVAALFAAFIIVYIKEFKREENTFKEIVKFRDQQAKMEKEHPPIMFVVAPPAPKKKAAPTVPAPNKKNIN